MTKTIKEWFEDLPEPYRSQAIENTDYDVLSFDAGSLFSALQIGFFWHGSPQGNDYWENLHHLIIEGQL